MAWPLRNWGYSIAWTSQISQLLFFENLEDYSIKFTDACHAGVSLKYKGVTSEIDRLCK